MRRKKSCIDFHLAMKFSFEMWEKFLEVVEGVFERSGELFSTARPVTFETKKFSLQISNLWTKLYLNITFPFHFNFISDSSAKCQKMSQDIIFTRYSKGIVVSSTIGILLSIYGLHVEISAQSDDDYEAMCDISEHVSCTKVFTSEYGRGFGIIGPILGENSFLNLPNPLYGILFYAMIAALSKYLRQIYLASSINHVMTELYKYLIRERRENLIFPLHHLWMKPYIKTYKQFQRKLSSIPVTGHTKSIRFGKAQVILSALSNLMSIYLAYLLYFILEDFCVVCVLSYVVNFINLILSSKRYNILREQKIQQILAEERIQSMKKSE